ncbi:general secretion pathway protein GspB [Desulfococcaceae bacterium HSG8]|nr:general secretion pathway protein GspB [Desulfococcaceae bacterium HSG8]
MSSILKALKKLEDKDFKKKKDQAWPVDTKKAVNQRARGNWIMNRLVSVMLVLVILAGGGWFILSRKPLWVQKFFPGTVSTENRADTGPAVPDKTETTPSKSVAASAQKMSEPDLKQKLPAISEESKKIDRVRKKERPSISKVESKKVDRVRKKERPSVSKAEIKKPDSLIHKKTPTPGKKMADLKKNPRRFSEKKAASAAEKKSAPKFAPAEKKAPKPDLPQKKTPKKSTSLSEGKPSNLDILQKKLSLLKEHASPDQLSKLEKIEKEISDLEKAEQKKKQTGSAKQRDSDLKIQALVWADDSEERLVMINNQIVRIGGLVDGATITHIGNDHVVVKKDGEEWKVEFKLQ